ncbi:MAG TPA: radical SAM family heme chaperone HemW [Chitinophagaceae bacterium]|nr:radical SAM family heme chaperone HemW [Chitinophagaceae bacterium]
MAGIYFHIPFCRQACHYCNFHFSTSTVYKNEFVAALLKELELQKNYLAGEAVETIYFGGGTPSLLEAAELDSVLNTLHSIFPVTDGAEITLEANPDDITAAKLIAWNSSGINRLSIGIQSFYDQDLQWMNRAHNSRQAEESISLSQRYGFNNISIDLIYGTPQLSNEHWKVNVQKALSFGIPHLSCYALTVEPKTTLHKQIRLHQTPGVDPDRQSEQFLLLMQWLEEAGYEHYEISNFARPGFRSRHNSSYWQGKKYLGLGPSAHSFNGASRQWNIANNKRYIDAVVNNIVPCEKEELSAVQKINEYIMTSLRTAEGLHLEKLDETATAQLIQASRKFIDHRLMDFSENCLRLTREGKLLADGIAADLFFDEG